MACHAALLVRSLQSVHEEGRVTHHGIIEAGQPLHLCKLLHRLLQHSNSVLTLGHLHILRSLAHCALVNVDGANHRLRIALRHHQGYQTRSRAHVKYPRAPSGPGAQKHPVSTDLHRTMVLEDSKMFKPKCHFGCKDIKISYHSCIFSRKSCTFAPQLWKKQ